MAGRRGSLDLELPEVAQVVGDHVEVCGIAVGDRHVAGARSLRVRVAGLADGELVQVQPRERVEPLAALEHQRQRREVALLGQVHADPAALAAEVGQLRQRCRSASSPRSASGAVSVTQRLSRFVSTLLRAGHGLGLAPPRHVVGLDAHAEGLGFALPPDRRVVPVSSSSIVKMMRTTTRRRARPRAPSPFRVVALLVADADVSIARGGDH